MGISPKTLLPQLRDELQFLEGATDGDGRNGYLIFDPIQHKYFRIGLRAAEALGFWQTGTAGALIEKMKQRGICLSLNDVSSLIRFVFANNLNVVASGETTTILKKKAFSQKSIIMRGLHGYLFFKIPLIRPQKFLNFAFPYVRWLGSSWAIWISAVLTIIGIYLTSRQFDVFLRTIVDFANWQGLVFFGAALLLLKTAHEFGHAFVATKYKCEVPVMGVAFMVLIPMLYTDVSDAWRLKNRHHRLMIDAAGMITEIIIGGLFLLLWSLLPDGPVRTLSFFIATTGWIMSVAVNLSPFMRFDGYHIFADTLGIHNLQTRGFALGRWQMRRFLFRISEKVPEQFSPRLHNLLVAYAWGTWIYRFFLFLGIALLVYFFFFKVLGIILFVVEIFWFLVLPIYHELKEWWQRRGDIKLQSRAFLSFSIFIAVTGSLFLPLGQNVGIPAVLVASREAQYYAPSDALVDDILVRPGSKVKRGDILIRLSSPILTEEKTLARLKLALVEKRLTRGGANLEERALRQILQREKRTLVSELDGLQKTSSELILRASMDGVVTEIAEGIRLGQWINQDVLLVHIVGSGSKFSAHGLISEININRLQIGSSGIFISENASPVKVNVRVQKIGFDVGLKGREFLYLSSTNGGPIKIDQSDSNNGRPSQTVFPVRFEVLTDNQQEWRHEQRGTITVQAIPESILAGFLRNAVSVVLRETGF